MVICKLVLFVMLLSFVVEVFLSNLMVVIGTLLSFILNVYLRQNVTTLQPIVNLSRSAKLWNAGVII
jgi:hypothetical protein